MTYFQDKDNITSVDLEKLIEFKISESIDLEFKNGRELSIDNDRQLDKLSVIITSFANTVGGYLIYGIETKRRKATGFDFLSDINIEPGIIEKKLVSRISKPIEGLKIHKIYFNQIPQKYVVVFDIPESRNAPHMAYDKRYYRRHQFKEHIMEEFEVRQAYNKNTIADIEFFGIVNTGGIPSMQNGLFKEVNFYPKFMIRNISSAIEHHYKFELYIPSSLHDPGFSALQNHYLKNEGVYSVFSIPNRSPLFQNELATIVEARLTVNKDNFNDYDKENIIIKLYYSNGIKQHTYRIRDIFRYKQKVLKYTDFVMNSLFDSQYEITPEN
ncbi:MAG: hypothetical protein Kow0068_13010 [Marinilabiliales bacterium]